MITIIRKYWNFFGSIIYNWIFHSCNSLEDDPFVPCFGCDDNAPRRSFDRRNDPHANETRGFVFKNPRSGERFWASRKIKRIICRIGSTTTRRCRLRVSRAVQIRRLPYIRVLKFVQAEEYLSEDDIDIIRFFQTLFLWCWMILDITNRKFLSRPRYVSSNKWTF